jgi:hypothetical protein
MRSTIDAVSSGIALSSPRSVLGNSRRQRRGFGDWVCR